MHGGISNNVDFWVRLSVSITARCRFFDIARESARECATCLDVLVAKTIIDESLAVEGKGLLLKAVLMLVGLIRSNSPSRDV